MMNEKRKCEHLSDLQEEYREKLAAKWIELLIDQVDVRRELERLERSMARNEK